MSRRIVIAGASGFIGRYLADAYRADGWNVARIGRTGDAVWGDSPALTRLLDGAEVLVNLAGKSVNCRYTKSNRARILRSRVDTTRELAAAVQACETPPPLWVNASTATIYRHAEDRPMTEATGELGAGFSVGIATAWERALFDGDLPGTRRVALRMAIVLGDGSALSPLLALTRLGLGGPQRDGRWWPTRDRLAAGTWHQARAQGGRQRFSWIHIADVLGIIRFLTDRPDLAGIVNASSPNPSDNATVMGVLREVLGMPFGLALPRWVLELGAVAIRTETELVLKSRWVIPERLVDAGYVFSYPELEPAIRQIAAPGPVRAKLPRPSANS